jgi:phage tail sheath protein FI
MAFFHGVRVREVPTSILTPASTTAGLPVVFGTAPVHLTNDPAKNVNRPVICYSWDEAVTALGYSDDWDAYTLSEVMYSQFKLYGVQPIIFVNVLDPKKHKTEVRDTEGHAVTEGRVILSDAVLLDTLKIKSSVAAEPAAHLTDYTAAYDDDGRLVISVTPTGALKTAEKLYLDYDKIDPSKVKDADIIGGASKSGTAGLEWLDAIYTLFSLVPGIVAAPGWSEHPAVASVMKAKAMNISGLFRCICLTDVDTGEAKYYADVNAWKNKNSYTGVNQVVCWPCVKNGDMVFHMSTHILGIIGVMDAANGDIPYESPSNMTMQATGICLKDGTETVVTYPQANLLNSQGIMTALNHGGGWKSWGNYTGAYPSITDVKDTFICVRRMFDWQYQTFILTNWQKVDRPLTLVLVRALADSEKIRLNGLVSRGYLLGADVVLREEENPLTDLLQGIIRIHVFMTPPVAAQSIEGILEYDVNNFKALFS